jgi:hypothetical protein
MSNSRADSAAADSSPEDGLGILFEPNQRGGKFGAGVVTQRHLLSFGSNVLLVVVSLMVLASWTYLGSDKDHLQTGKEIFEFAKVTLPPIATLVLGFYFRGSRSHE